MSLLFGFQVAYKADYKHDIVDYNYPATLTPAYQTTMKLVPLKDVSPPPPFYSMFDVEQSLGSKMGRKKSHRYTGGWRDWERGLPLLWEVNV